MVCVGIGVSKDKHDCFIVRSEGEAPAEVFAVPNTLDGFSRKSGLSQHRRTKLKEGLRQPGSTATTCSGFFLTTVCSPIS